jgi:cystathionine beta-lyase/cystathionine gamma-synthase
MSTLTKASLRLDWTDEPSRSVLEESLADLRADFAELLVLSRSADARLASALAELDRARTELHSATFEALVRQLEAARSRYSSYGRRLLALERLAAPDRDPTRALLVELAAAKAAEADLLRAEQAVVASLATAAEWQSPSFLHSTMPAAGVGSGRIRPHWNDYKRDRHLEGEAYERAYVSELVPGQPGVQALLTNCGMAAFTTILAFLRDEGWLERPVVVGQGLYHETRHLLERALPGSVLEVDERDTDTLVRAIEELRPGAVFLDSLANTKWMPMPDLPAVLERLDERSYLVLDNTGLSVSCRPFAFAPPSARLIVFESLLKYAQLGLDRANAGVIVARADDAEALADYREHLGTNVADVAVHALPPPNRYVLERRLARLQRNATALAEGLRERAGKRVHVVYPGLADHPSHSVAKRLAFHGGCLSIVFRKDRTLRRAHAFAEAAIAEAKRADLPLIAGSSFGFNTTRVYLTAPPATAGAPFVRVAAGTEHRLDAEALAKALAAAVRMLAP